MSVIIGAMGDTTAATQGSLLTRLRNDAGLSQEELAHRSGLSARSIGDLERGVVARPRRASLEALAAGLRLQDERRAEFFSHYRSGRRHYPGAPGPVLDSGSLVPAQLPHPTFGFVGRSAELERIDSAVRRGARIITVEGGAGMGKTELAVQWAHAARSDFPDGQLFVRLRGFGLTRPVEPQAAIADLLRSIGLADDEIPAGLEARAALLRTRLADRRCLVVLDDAHDSAQVEPLLPGSGHHVVLVTSRRRLDGLRARFGAAAVQVGPLDDGAAAELVALASEGGDGAGDHGADRTIATRCSGMPLALRLASALVTRGAPSNVLDLPAVEDESLSVRDLVGHSLTGLGQDAHHAFGLLGLLTLADPSMSVVAALAGWDEPQLVAALDRLAALHLVQVRADATIHLHDLVHLLAAERAAEWPRAERDAAYDRLEQFLGRVDDITTDRCWMDHNWPTALEAAHIALVQGRFASVQRIASSWSFHLYRSLRDDDATTLHELALAAADRGGDLTARGWVLRQRAQIEIRAGDLAGAAASVEEAVRVAETTKDPEAEAESLGQLGALAARQGRFADAIQHLERAVAVAELHPTACTPSDVASLVNNLGIFHLRLGHTDLARTTLTRAIGLARAAGAPDAECAARNSLASLRTREGDLRGAVQEFEAGLEAAGRAHNVEGQAVIRARLASVLLELGGAGRAAELLESGKDCLAHTGADAPRQVQVLLALAHAQLALHRGDVDDAREMFTSTLKEARAIHERAVEASALLGLGNCAHAIDDQTTARRLFQDALTLRHELGYVTTELEQKVLACSSR